MNPVSSSDQIDWGNALQMGALDPLAPSQEENESARSQIERTKKVVLPALNQLSDVSNIVGPLYDLHNNKIQKIAGEIKHLQALNSKMIDLSSAVNKLINEAKKNNKKEIPLPDHVRRLILDLQENGINLNWDVEKTCTTEDLEGHKSTVSSLSDHNKTEMQTKFSTELQVSITRLQALLDSLKMILNRVAKTSDAIIERTR